MIFLTVGTEYPFDRLVRTVDEMADRGELFDTVFAQIGNSKYLPRNMEWIDIMPRSEYEQYMKDCTAVIAHAGMGTIIQCIEMRKPLLVMPRLPEHGEIVSDHQLGSTRKFGEQGYILFAENETELPAKIYELRDFVPLERPAEDTKISQHIIAFLEKIEKKSHT